MFEDKSPTEMKDSLHEKWYLQKTKARNEVLGVLANSLKRVVLTAKHQSFLLLLILVPHPRSPYHGSGLPCGGCCTNKCRPKRNAWTVSLGERRDGYSQFDGSTWKGSLNNRPHHTGSSTFRGPRGQALGKWKEKGHLRPSVAVWQVLCPVLWWQLYRIYWSQAITCFHFLIIHPFLCY